MILDAIALSLPDKKEQSTNLDGDAGEIAAWPWDWFYYVGTVVLGMDERTFWRTPLRKLMALWEVHKEVNGLNKTGKSEEKEVFIDELW